MISGTIPTFLPLSLLQPDLVDSQLEDSCWILSSVSFGSLSRLDIPLLHTVTAARDNGDLQEQSGTIPGPWVAAAQIPAQGKARCCVRFAALMTHPDEPHFYQQAFQPLYFYWENADP